MQDTPCSIHLYDASRDSREGLALFLFSFFICCFISSVYWHCMHGQVRKFGQISGVGGPFDTSLARAMGEESSAMEEKSDYLERLRGARQREMDI